jgi:luciferase family oxidoreductase group 1
MLSHYSPLKVAEQFRMLEALFPGRIDMGIGRAPGGDSRAASALAYGRGVLGIDAFPRQVEDLLGWVDDSLADDHPFRRVRAMPRIGSVPEPWLLGSGGSSAEYAARFGCGYSFAQFISGLDGAPLVRAYRDAFRPSRRMTAPAASVGIGVVCAPTDAEAQRLGLSLELWRGRVARGRDRGIPSPAEAEEELGAAGLDPELFREDPRCSRATPPPCANGSWRSPSATPSRS